MTTHRGLWPLLLVLISLTAGAAVLKGISLSSGLPKRVRLQQQQNRLPPWGDGPADHSMPRQGGGGIAQP